MFWTVLSAAPILVLPLLAIALAGALGPLAAASIWGLGLIAGFAGWGSWLARRLCPGLSVDLGLRAAWGLALTVAAGGPLCLVGAARRPVLLAWAFGGIALAARDGGRWLARRARSWQWPPAPAWSGADALVAAVLLGAVVLTYLGAAARGGPNPSDDYVAYLPFVRKLLQTGTFVDPFSVRRMAAYGGQTYLQALTLLGAEDAQIALFDQGICLVLLVGLLLGFVKESASASRLFILLSVLVLVMLPEVRINSASEMSGALGFVAVFRTLVVVDRARLEGWGAAVLVALPIAAVSTLRQNYLAVSFLVMLALLLPVTGEPLRVRWRSLRRVGLMVGACLLPWAALAFRSNHSFLFPLFPGNYDLHYAAITGTSGWDARLRFYLGALFHDDPIRAMPLVILAAPAVARVPMRRAVLGLWAGTIVGFAFVALSMPEAEMFSVARYAFASVVALVLGASLAASELGSADGVQRDFVGVALLVVALGIQVHGTYAPALRNVTGAMGRIGASNRTPPSMAATAPEVLKMQAAVPAGERLLVLIERPYLLDFARNRIALLDLPGAASPRAALPLMRGPEEIARYLLAEGYQYFAFTLPNAAQNDLYRRQHWEKQLHGQQAVWRNTAPLFLAAFEALDHFARTRRHVYEDGHLVVVDLAQAATPAS